MLVDRKNKRIRHYQADPANPNALANATIQAIFEDAAGNCWIGTNKGLHLFDRDKGTFTRFQHDDKDPHSITNDRIMAIRGDGHGQILIGTQGGGLNIFDTHNKTFSSFRWNSRAANGISSDIVNSLFPADSDRVWIGTENALDLMDIHGGSFVHYQRSLIGEGSLNNNTVLTLLQDNTGILWAGTAEGGINKYDPNLFFFDLYKKTSDPNSLGADLVTSFSEEAGGDIWIGTDGGGLDQWQRQTNRFVHYLSDPANAGSLSGNAILSLLMSRKKDRLWIGTYGSGLDRLDLATKKFQHFRSAAGIHGLDNASIYALLEDRDGNIWMGTNGGGVNVLHGDGSITQHHHTDDADSISNDYIRCLLEDRKGRIWIGTYSGGISVYDPQSRKFTLYDKVNNGLSNQVVFSLCEDAQGNIWAGTMGGGLDLFDPQRKRFITYNEDSGLSNNIVNSIIGDEKGYLWLSTNKGISRFDPRTKKFRNYGVHNGVQNPEFTIGAGYRTSNGRILFGGITGFNVFNPGEVRDNRIPPSCRFTGFFLFNKPVKPGQQGSPLKGDINEVKEITLAYDQSDFTIGYAALSYTAPSEDQYAYILQGFDKTWNYVGGERKATYTNLAPGTYRFMIRSANNDGVWSRNDTILTIHITPPFWRTWWAYILYLITAAAILYFIYRDIATREKLKGQIRLERMTAEKMKELNTIKLNFFTNVSHELRTPLSLILDPLRKIIRDDLSIDQVKRYGSLMYSNAQRLMKLVDQMLDLRKLEAGHGRLMARPANIVRVTRNIAALFDIHAVERNIHYTITTSLDTLTVWIDQDKFEKIIFNLISNAFKYTPDNGTISIHIACEPNEGIAQQIGFAVIHVTDTGIGIPPHLKDRVFEIFYQIEGASRFETGSTGIGLALTRELIELHKGRVEVVSELGKGSDFIIYLPLGNEHLDESQQSTSKDQDQSPPLILNNTSSLPLENSIPLTLDESLPLILLVEDNHDLREYLKTELQAFYKVEEAPDGLSGHELALQLIPDLVLSDIMMPGLNGLELCEKLKMDERSSHIPFILLTARQADTHQIEGYSAGADAYIPKPFNMEVILARIKNLLDSRKKLRELYGRTTTPHAPADADPAAGNPDTADPALVELPAMSTLDQQFLNKAIRMIEANLADITFDTDTLAEKLKVSRRQLYRKLKALTNQTVHDFVTGIRMQNAAALLVTGEYSIAEVAYKVGYSEPANFSRSFTNRFGKSPKKYITEYRASPPR